MGGRKWRINLTNTKEQSVVLKGGIPTPRGYEVVTANNDADDSAVNMTTEKLVQAKQRAAMNIAYGPGKSLFTTAFMLWMSGSSIQIFSIMMTGMALFNPLKAIFTVNDAFRQFDKEEGVDTKIPKMIFVALQVLSLGVALYKCSTMGLLPVTSVDWVEYLPKVQYIEHGMRLVGSSGSGLLV